MSHASKLISVVIPAYNEEACVDELASRLERVFEALPNYDFEVIVVENGSWDRTYELLLDIRRRDPRFKIVQLARNFGADGGFTAGLMHARGEAAVIMSADLQDPPEMIEQLVAKWEEGYENVYGIVTARRGTGLVRRINSRAFYWVIGKLTDNLVPPNASDFRLVDRRVYETVNTMNEQNRFLRGLFAWVGYRSVGIEYERPPRHGGSSKANTMHVLDLATRGILAHSNVPLKVIPLVGGAISLFSFVGLLYVGVTYFFFGLPFQGFGTIVGLSLLLFGFLFSILGIIGQYIGLIYEEVKRRPNFVVRETVGLDPERKLAALGDSTRWSSGLDLEDRERGVAEDEV